MMNSILQRAELYATFTEKPVLYVHNLFGDGVDYWFICYDFSPANPSNHIYNNELRNGKCINDMMNMPQELDNVMLNTKLEEINRTYITFTNNVSWIKIK